MDAWRRATCSDARGETNAGGRWWQKSVRRRVLPDTLVEDLYGATGWPARGLCVCSPERGLGENLGLGDTGMDTRSGPT